jgi:hypothetical protein
VRPGTGPRRGTPRHACVPRCRSAYLPARLPDPRLPRPCPPAAAPSPFCPPTPSPSPDPLSAPAQTAAGLLAAHGHVVTLLFGASYADRAAALRAALTPNGGAITLDVRGPDGATTHVHGRLAGITTSLAAAVPAADIVIVSLNGPAMGPALEALAPHLRPHQLLLLLQGLGGVNFAQLAKAMPLGSPLPLYAASKTLPWACRLLGPGHVSVCGTKAVVGLALAPGTSPLLRAMLPPLLGGLLPGTRFVLEENPLDFVYLPYDILGNPVLVSPSRYLAWFPCLPRGPLEAKRQPAQRAQNAGMGSSDLPAPAAHAASLHACYCDVHLRTQLRREAKARAALPTSPSLLLQHPGMMYGAWHDWDGTPLPEKPLFYHSASHASVEAVEGLQSEAEAVIAAYSKFLGLPAPVPVRDVRADLADCYGSAIKDPSTLYSLLRTNAAYAGIYHPMKPAAPGGAAGWVPDFHSRLLSEDVPCGLVAIKGVAEILGVPTPWIDRVVVWAQEKLGKEYIVDGRLAGADVAASDAPQRFGITEAAGLVISAPKPIPRAASSLLSPFAAAAAQQHLAPAAAPASGGRRAVSFSCAARAQSGATSRALSAADSCGAAQLRAVAAALSGGLGRSFSFCGAHSSGFSLPSALEPIC